MSRKLNVLMLGWEFPPEINGGLGIACYGIAKALSSKVNLKVVLPKSDPNFHVENVDVIGLNNLNQLKHKYKTYKILNESKEVLATLSEEEYNSIYEKYASFSELYEVSVKGIDPYNSEKLLQTRFSEERIKEILHNKEIHKNIDNTTTTIDAEEFEEDLNTFEIGHLYGDDVESKVVEYANYVVDLARNIEFDVIHAHDWMTILAGLKLKWMYNKPLIIHAHALSYDRGGPNARGWIYDLEKYGMENADAIIPVSYYTGSVVTGHYGIPSDKVFPIHNGVDDVTTFKSKKTIPEKLVLFLGRITEQKGPEFFLDIASKVFELNNNVRFVMAGVGDKMKRLIETGAYRQIGNKFHFTGFLNRDKVNQLLSIADVYCMPSVSEPFGLSAMEAAQFGIPAVISKQSGVGEVLHHALKADFWDTDLMAQHIVHLIEDEDFANQVVADTFKDIEAITWDACSQKIVNVYLKQL